MNGKKRKEKFTSWKEQTGILSKLLFSWEHSMSKERPGSTSPWEISRSLACSSSIWTNLDPVAPLQYKSLISDVTSKPRPKAWIELQRVVVKASELKLIFFSINEKYLFWRACLVGSFIFCLFLSFLFFVERWGSLELWTWKLVTFVWWFGFFFLVWL